MSEFLVFKTVDEKYPGSNCLENGHLMAIYHSFSVWNKGQNQCISCPTFTFTKILQWSI